MKLQAQKIGSRVWLCLLLATCAALDAGCTRAHYRRQADRDVYNLVQQKANHPHWAMPDYTIDIDPRSRMYNPGNPDRPPIPPDDPTGHQLMHAVDNKKGYPGWHDNGDTPFVANPVWPDYIDFKPDGTLDLNSENAVRLALLNNRGYQTQLETLYLSALDVSFERFRFDVQGFAGSSLFYTADGPRHGLNKGIGQSSSLLNLNTFSNSPTADLALRKSFATGSTMVVDMANSLVWQFSGPNDYTGNTLINFAIFQPLLRGAGRDRILERLTVAERTLLSNVRAMERYRLSFYVNVMTGRNLESGPNRRGGVLGAGLEGFTGFGNGFGNLGGSGGGAGATASGGGGAGAAQIGGYMGLLQDLQAMHNLEDNVKRLRSNLFRSEQFLNELRTRVGDPALVNNILRQDLQVAQSRQALFNSESTLINTRNAFQASLDNFKTNTLNLPSQICMQIADPMLDQFQLFDRGTIEQQVEVDELIAGLGEVRLKIAEHIESSPAPDPNDPARTIIISRLEWYPELADHLQQLKKLVEPLRAMRAEILDTLIPSAEKDLARFHNSMGRRKAWIERLNQQITEVSSEKCALLPIPDINQEVFRVDRLQRSYDDMVPQLAALQNKVTVDYENYLNEHEQRIDKLIAEGNTYSPTKLFDDLYYGVLYPRREAGQANQITDVLVIMPSDLLALQLIQARARVEGIELKPVDMDAKHALDVARKYRRDWMNARQSLVDSWRLIEFNADNLESTLDIFFSGDIRNQSDDPFALRGDTGRLRVGVQFDAPIVRRSERNVYRQSLIEYQQARRNYYGYEDAVGRNLRALIRSAQTNQINFELQRLAVLEAARQIDRNEDLRIDQELTNAQAGVTAARDAVSALSDLLQAQNNFMNIWFNHESLRRSLDLDLGMLQLDSEGFWIDPGKMDENYGNEDPWLWRTCFGPALEPGEDPATQGLEQLPLGQRSADPGEPDGAEALPAPDYPRSPADSGIPGIPGVRGIPREPTPSPAPGVETGTLPDLELHPSLSQGPALIGPVSR